MLPITHYDVFKKVSQPFFADIINEVHETKRSGEAISPVLGIPETSACHKEKIRFIEENIALIMKINNIPHTEAHMLFRESVETHPEIKAQIEDTIKDIECSYYSLINFCLFGKKTFYFTKGLSQLLCNTRANPSADSLNLPYKSCLFVYDNEEVIQAYYSIMGLDAFPEFRGSDTIGGVLSSYLLEINNDELPSDDLLLAQQDGLALEGKKTIGIYSFHTHNGSIKSHSNRIFLFENDAKLEDILSANSSLTGNIQLFGKQSANEKEIALYEERTMPLYRTIFNSLLYLNSTAPELEERFSHHAKIRAEAKRCKSPKNKAKKLEKLNTESSLDFTLAGATVRPIYIDKSKVIDSVEREADSSSGRKVGYQFMVRGHWRNQAHGEGLSQRKLIWIKPYMKGQDMAEIAQDRPYIVK